jgi:hypothetical protein
MVEHGARIPESLSLNLVPGIGYYEFVYMYFSSISKEIFLYNISMSISIHIHKHSSIQCCITNVVDKSSFYK